jgi:cytochrome c nitrite reductase small subunit
MVAIVAVVGLTVGLGLFTFHYGEGAAYLSDNPDACVNCHIMQEQFDSWINSSHQPATVCNSCHVPDGPIAKWISKADNGFFHSVAFTPQEPSRPDPYQATQCPHRAGQLRELSLRFRSRDARRPARRRGRMRPLPQGCRPCSLALNTRISR